MINELISMTSPAARKNKYRVFLPVFGDMGKEMDVLCHTSNMPGRTLTPVEVVVKGHKCQIAGSTSLEGTWEATFYNTEGLNIRKYFINWMKEVHDNTFRSTLTPDIFGNIQDDYDRATDKVNGAIADPLGTLLGQNYTIIYQKDIRVHQLNAIGEPSSGVTLFGAFPISVGDIELDDSAGEVSTTTVTFAYNDIAVEVTDGDKPSALDALKSFARTSVNSRA